MAKHTPHRAHSAFRAQPHFIRPTAVALAVAACFSCPVLANPTNPTVVHGTATFATAGNILNITNSANAIINWGSFSISVGELTRFIQPSALSAVLNRVTGQDPSAILGALQSNGRVFLINPNGIVFGAGAQIDVAGLVASTLNLSNEDFLNNRMRFTDGVGAGSVVNQGQITGGSVYLVGNAVTNNGLITSPGGEVVLAAGNSVELVNPGTPNLRVEIVAPDNEARNLGTISAEAGRIGIYAGLIKQGGTISADSAVSEGGRIILKSTRKTVLEGGSLTTARGTSGGEILALSDMTDGVTEVAGKLDASAVTTSGVPGIGGFIETSAAKVQVANSAMITTAGSDGGQSGTWLIDPYDFVIAASGGNINAATLVSALVNGNVVISTAPSGADFYGSDIGVGDILVQQAVSWSNGNSLTLTAERHVQVDQAINNGGSGGINLYAGWDGSSSPAAPTLGNFGGIQLNAPVTTGGNVTLKANNDIIQGSSGPISAATLEAVSLNGSVNLANPSTVNSVGTIAGSANGSFAFRNAGDLIIGTVGLSSGIQVTANGGGDASINIAVTGGQLTVNNPVYAYGGDGSEGQAGGNATITLASSGSMQINGSFNSITADGGEGGYGYYSTAAGNGGNATVNLTSGGGLTIAAEVRANGGSGGYGYSGAADGGRGGDGVVNATAAGVLSVSDAYGGVIGLGGQGGYSDYGQAGRGGDGKVMLSAVGGITVASGREVHGRGGYGGHGGGGSYSYSYGDGFGGNGGDGLVQLTSTGGNINVMGQVRAQGGWGGEGGEGGTYPGSGGNAAVSLISAGAVTISGGQIYADGGEVANYAFGTSGGTASVVVSSTGATSISGNAYVYAIGGDGGMAAVNLTSSGGITISDSQVYTYGGYAGSGGDGGAATTTVQANAGNLLISSSSIYAKGGDAGYYSVAGDGGTGVVNIGSAGSTTINNSYIYAEGGNAAYLGTGNGGNAVVLVSAGGGLTVSNSLLMSSGGWADAGQGGAAGLTMLAGGNIQFEGAEGSAYGGGSNSNAGGDAGLLLQSLGGNIVLDSNYYYTLSAFGGGHTPGTSSVVVSAAGSVSLVNNADIYTSGAAGIFSGSNVSLDNAYLYAGSSASVTASGTLALTNGSSINGGSSTYITMGGDVTLDNNSTIHGNPDVYMTVGGVININNGSKVSAGSPSTINLTFPMLTSGGFFVNGLEGVVWDALTFTGFCAQTCPAILGTNLLVTYGDGQGGQSLTIPTEALIVAMGESTKPPDPNKDKDVFDEISEEKKKDAPVCR